jgi:hypothetical protein
MVNVFYPRQNRKQREEDEGMDEVEEYSRSKQDRERNQEKQSFNQPRREHSTRYGYAPLMACMLDIAYVPAKRGSNNPNTNTQQHLMIL